MKKILLILLFTSCSVFKATRKNSFETTLSKQNQQLEQVSALKAAQSDRLYKSWTQDSSLFTAYILADGLYKIDTDSGIRGEKARIFVKATKMQRIQVQDSSRNKSLGKSDSLNVRNSYEKISQKQKKQENKRIGLPISWYVVAVFLCIGWFFYKRYKK